MSADTYFSGDRTKSNFVFHWQHELCKLPPSSVAWEWDDVVGEGSGKVAYQCAYRMRCKDCIVKVEDGLYRTSEELERYLSEHDIELESWRCALSGDDGAVLVEGHGRIARRMREGLECCECDEPFGSVHSARIHYVSSHASPGGSDSSVTRGSQATLDEFSRVSDSM